MFLWRIGREGLREGRVVVEEGGERMMGKWMVVVVLGSH